MIDFFKTLKLMGFPMDDAVREYRRIADSGDVLAWQNQQRTSIVDFHWKNNPYYRSFLGSWRGSWDEVPIITKEHLQGKPVEKTPSDRLSGYYVASTSGSSGNPFYFAKDKLTHALIWVNIAEHYNNVGISLNDLQARFYGTPLSGVGKYKEMAKDLFANRIRFTVFNLNDAVLMKWVQKIRSKPFKYFYGYTNSLLVFAKFLNSRDIILKDICPTLRLCIVTSELCSESDQQFLEDSFGVPVYNEYGASEVCVIGFGRNQEWLVSDPLVYLEVVGDNGIILPDGQPGRLLCTLLHNKGTPIIRYDIGDVGAISRRNGKTYLTQLAGRTNDMVILPGGKKVPGFTFYYVARAVLEKSDLMKEYRVVYLGNGHFNVEIVADQAIDFKTENLVKKAFEEYLESGLDVSVKRVSEISRTGAGKFQHFLNLEADAVS